MMPAKKKQPNADKELQHGQRVNISAKYKRVRELIGRDWWKYWRVVNFMGEHCIFLGYRTLHDGKVLSYEYFPHTLDRETSIKAALVSCGPRTNPIYVPLDRVEVAK